MTNKYKVLMVDDGHLACKDIHNRLSEHENIKIVTEAKDV